MAAGRPQCRAPRAVARAARARRRASSGSLLVTRTVRAAEASSRRRTTPAPSSMRLEVVQHDEDVGLAGSSTASASAGLAGDRAAQGQRDLADQLSGVHRLGHLEVDDVGEALLHVGGHQRRHPRLAAAADPGERDAAGPRRRSSSAATSCRSSSRPYVVEASTGIRARLRGWSPAVGRADGGSVRAVAQDARLELLQRHAGLDAQLVGERGARLGVDGDRLVAGGRWRRARTSAAPTAARGSGARRRGRGSR